MSFRKKNPTFHIKNRDVMVNDCIVLLEWAVKNGKREVSLNLICDETGIAYETLRTIIIEAMECKEASGLYGIAKEYGYEFYIFPEWNKSDRWKHRKKLIDAVKWSEPDDSPFNGSIINMEDTYEN